METIAGLIAAVLKSGASDPDVIPNARGQVDEICRQYPLPGSNAG
jgi:hypothetical protein